MLELKDFVYDIANTKSYGHILVDVNSWESDRLLRTVNLKGSLVPTYMTKVVKINPAPAYRPLPFKEGDIVVLSNIAVRIGLLKAFQLPNSSNNYANVHISQVLGYFKDNKISIDNFQPLYDKVVLNKIEVPSSNYFSYVTDSMSVGEVINTGNGGFTEEWKHRDMNVKVGDKVLIRDNVTTTICIDGEEYYITEDSNVVGKFNSTYDIQDLTLFNADYSIFEEHENDTIAGSFLYKPLTSSSDDISRMYQENTFKTVVSDVFDNGVYLISRFDTEYIKFKNKDYFIVKNEKVMAKQAKGDM